jgi:hypothetical protein
VGVTRLWRGGGQHSGGDSGKILAGHGGHLAVACWGEQQVALEDAGGGQQRALVQAGAQERAGKARPVDGRFGVGVPPGLREAGRGGRSQEGEVDQVLDTRGPGGLDEVVVLGEPTRRRLGQAHHEDPVDPS